MAKVDPIVQVQLRSRRHHAPGRKLRLLVRRPPRWLHPVNAEKALEAQLLARVNAVADAVKAKLFPKLQHLAAEARRVRGDAWSDEVDGTFREIRLQVKDLAPGAEALAAGTAREVAVFNLAQWRTIVRATLGIDLFTAEPWLREELRSWASETANLITSLEDDEVKQVAVWTNRGLREGWRWEDIAKQVEDRFDVSRNRARFIARDQVGTLNGHLTQRRQEAAGVTSYTWRDSRDERVRGNPDGLYPKAKPSHWARNGKKFSWSDPPEGGAPGMDFGCRCTSEPDLSGLIDTYNDEE